MTMPRNNTPKSGDFGDYEKIPTGDFVTGVISQVEIKKDYNHVYNGETKIYDAVRIKFDIDGCEMPHQTFFMRFSYDKKSKLYTKFIKPLVEDAEPYMQDFDIENLDGMRVKMLWIDNDNGYQILSVIQPEGDKLSSWSE